MATFIRTVQRTSRCLVSTARARAFHSTPFQRDKFVCPDIPDFNHIISNKDRLTVVDFHADWCAPCHALYPLLERLTSDEKTETTSGLPLDLVKVDMQVGDGFYLIQEHKIRMFPTVIVFRAGKPVDQFFGVLNEKAVRNFFRKL